MPLRDRSFRYTALTVLPMMLGGCALTSVLPTVAVPLVLTGTLARIIVSAGSPTVQSGTLSFESPDNVNIGRGSLEIDPGAVSLQRSTIGKVNTIVQQTQDDCLAACAAAGIDTGSCEAVCSAGLLQITVWVAAAESLDEVCTGGTRDTYGPYMVTLDETGNGISVSPSRISLLPFTLQLLNLGSMSICIEVVAPETGEVLLSELTANVGL